MASSFFLPFTSKNMGATCDNITKDGREIFIRPLLLPRVGHCKKGRPKEIPKQREPFCWCHTANRYRCKSNANIFWLHFNKWIRFCNELYLCFNTFHLFYFNIFQHFTNIAKTDESFWTPDIFPLDVEKYIQRGIQRCLNYLNIIPATQIVNFLRCEQPVS